MEEHLEIFDILYEIKGQISCQNYLRLTRKATQLCKIAKQYIIEKIHKDSPKKVRFADEPIFFPDFFYTNECQCENEDLCTTSFMAFCQCKNCPKFLSENPILRNLFCDHPIEFTKIPIIDQSYDSKKIMSTIKKHYDLNKNIYNRKDRIIIAISLFDFGMRNMKFLRDFPQLSKIFNERVWKFSEHDDFLDYVHMNNFNVNIWNNHFGIKN